MAKVIERTCVLLLALLVLGMLAMASAGAASAAQNKAGWIAKQFVLNDDTYRFDGTRSSLSVVPAQGAVSIMGIMGTMGPNAWSAAAPNTYTFKAKFTCDHAGYGSRYGRILAQAITPHTALITVKNNKVISATLDGKWNMLTEKPI